ncbi:MAG TPA: hypothetical protein VF756_16420, partial [Thermoanaerobaculia bacterium]
MVKRSVLLLLALLAAAADPAQAAREQQPNDADTRRPEAPKGSSEAASGVPADDFGPRQAVLEKPWFRFYSHFGFNLYDAVLTSATERRAKRADPLHEGGCFGALVQEERSAWDAAVSYYAETVAATSDFSREREIIRAHLTGAELSLDDDDRRDLRLSLLFLRAAAPA